MEREKYLQCLSIMAELEGQWYRGNDGLYYFYKPEEMSQKAIEVANVLNENYIEGMKEWNRFIEIGGTSNDEEDNFEDYLEI